MRGEEADDLAARLAQARQQLAEMGASQPGSPHSQATMSPLSDSDQAKHWLPRAVSDAASHAMLPNSRLRIAQVGSLHLMQTCQLSMYDIASVTQNAGCQM